MEGEFCLFSYEQSNFTLSHQFLLENSKLLRYRNNFDFRVLKLLEFKKEKN